VEVERPMSGEIALFLAIDGIASGAIYVLVGLGIVLIFSVTRVIFVPFGDIVAFSALTLASLQLNRVPGTIYLLGVLALVAGVMEGVHWARRGNRDRLLKGVALYGLLPLLPALAAWLLAGQSLPTAAQIALTLALVVPIAPLLNRIAFRPIADASVLTLLMVAVALHFAVAGLGLLFFGPEGFRTRPLTDGVYEFGGLVVTGQALLIIAACVVFSLLLFLFFGHTLPGRALRATAVNRTGARLVGINPAQTGTLAFTLASFIGGISGLLIGPVTTIYYDSGFLIGLKAFVAAIIGGLASYPVTAVGAVFVGLLESFASFWNSALKETVVFAFLIPVLLWRSLALGHHDEEQEEVDA
jgi:branched-subunit amino acid ABC-type transport system permease component